MKEWRVRQNENGYHWHLYDQHNLELYFVGDGAEEYLQEIAERHNSSVSSLEKRIAELETILKFCQGVLQISYEDDFNETDLGKKVAAALSGRAPVASKADDASRQKEFDTTQPGMRATLIKIAVTSRDSSRSTEERIEIIANLSEAIVLAPFPSTQGDVRETELPNPELDELHDELHKMIQCSIFGWPDDTNSQAHQLLYKIRRVSEAYSVGRGSDSGDASSKPEPPNTARLDEPIWDSRNSDEP